MAKQVIKNAFLTLGGTDYTAQIESIELSVEADKQVVTNMDSAGWEESLQGIKSGSITVAMKMDADLSGFFAALWAVFIHATTNTWAAVLKREDAATSASNKSYSFSVLVTQAGLNLSVGQAFGRSFTFPITGAVTAADA